MLEAADGAEDCSRGAVGNSFEFSFMETVIPVVDDSVFRGLLNPEDNPELASVLVAGTGETTWETPGNIPPSTAGLGRFVRCQS